MRQRRVIACIGARDTPRHLLPIMEEIGYQLAKRGRMIRSGRAEGADYEFQKGVERYCRESGISASERQEIYLPYSGFRGEQPSQERGILDFSQSENKDKAIEIAIKHYIEPQKTEAWEEWMKNLMGRNTFQILGKELIDPCLSVICYTKDGSIDGSRKSSGGTGQALRLASAYNIPVFNLKNENHLRFVEKHILGTDNLNLTPPSHNY